MARFINEKGNRYGKILVKNIAFIKSEEAYFHCECDCGNTSIVRGCNLRNGNTKSCGCEKGYKKECGVSSFNNLYYQYKLRAERKNMLWKLNKNEFRILINGDCYYCGLSPSQKYHKRNQNGETIYNGIDRQNNSIGYTVENSVSCCGKCNRAKYTMTKYEFLEHIMKIYHYHKLDVCGDLTGSNTASTQTAGILPPEKQFSHPGLFPAQEGDQ